MTNIYFFRSGRNYDNMRSEQEESYKIKIICYNNWTDLLQMKVVNVREYNRAIIIEKQKSNRDDEFVHILEDELNIAMPIFERRRDDIELKMRINLSFSRKAGL